MISKQSCSNWKHSAMDFTYFGSRLLSTWKLDGNSDDSGSVLTPTSAWADENEGTWRLGPAGGVGGTGVVNVGATGSGTVSGTVSDTVSGTVSGKALNAPSCGGFRSSCGGSNSENVAGMVAAVAAASADAATNVWPTSSSSCKRPSFSIKSPSSLSIESTLFCEVGISSALESTLSFSALSFRPWISTWHASRASRASVSNAKEKLTHRGPKGACEQQP